MPFGFPPATGYGTLLPEFPLATVIFVGVVTAEVATGLVVLQFKLVLQLDDPEDMVQLVAVRVPVMAVKVAVQVLEAFIVTDPSEQSASPLQLAKTELALGEAVRVTLVPELYGSEQSAPQLIPAGLEVTVPEPVPDLVTERVYVTAAQTLPFQEVPAAQLEVTVLLASSMELL